MKHLALAAAIVLAAATLHAQESELHFKERSDAESAELDLKFPADDPNAINELFEEVNVERADDAVVVSTARTQYAQAPNEEGKDRIQVQTDKDVVVIRVDKTVPMRELLEQIERVRNGNPNINIAIKNTAEDGEEEWSFYQTGESNEADERVHTRSMSDLVELSLQNNPEIQAVRAELAASQARLKQMELRIASELVRRQSELQKLMRERESTERLVEKEFATEEELIDIDARIQDTEAQLKYLLGDSMLELSQVKARPTNLSFHITQTQKTATTQGINWSSTAAEPRPSIEDIESSRIRDLLSNPVSLTFEEVAIADICDFISDTYELNFSIDVVVRDSIVDVRLVDVSIHDALLAIAEAHELVFIVRDYGIFATTRDRAHRIPGPSIPEGVPFASGNEKIPYIGDIPLLGYFFRGKADQADRTRDLLEVIKREGESTIEYDVDGDGAKEEIVIRKRQDAPDKNQ